MRTRLIKTRETYKEENGHIIRGSCMEEELRGFYPNVPKPSVGWVQRLGAGCLKWYLALVKLLWMRLGKEKTQELMRELLEDNAKAVPVEKLKKALGIESSDALACARYLASLWSTTGISTEVLPESTPRRAVLRVHRCPAYPNYPPEEFKGKYDVTEEICNMMIYYDELHVKKFNPKLKLVHRGLPKLSRGDTYCEFIITEEESSSIDLSLQS